MANACGQMQKQWKQRQRYHHCHVRHLVDPVKFVSKDNVLVQNVFLIRIVLLIVSVTKFVKSVNNVTIIRVVVESKENVDPMKFVKGIVVIVSNLRVFVLVKNQFFVLFPVWMVVVVSVFIVVNVVQIGRDIDVNNVEIVSNENFSLLSNNKEGR